MQSEGKFLRHFKEAAPLAVSTFGSKIGHLTLRMILHSSSKKVGLVAHHYHHFVRAILQELFPGLNGQGGTICLLLTHLESGNKQKQNSNTI